MSRCCEPLSGVVPPHLAAISTNAPTADIVPPSRTTAAGTAIARSVRLPLGNGGSRRVGENSSRRPTPISCSPCPVAWRHWSCRTRRSSMIFCFVPVRKPSSKWRAIRDTLGQRSASSVSCTPGSSNSNFIRMFIVSRPLAASPPIVPVGLAQGKITFFPKRCCGKSFAASSSTLKQAFQDGLLRFEGNLKLLAKPKIFAAWLRPLYRQDWVVYLKRPFGGPEYVLQYLGRYTIAWPSLTIGWSLSPMARSPFVGAIPLTTTNRSCCLYRSMSS